MSPVRRWLRRAGFTALKLLGAFMLARRWSAGRLRIIAWHGLSVGQEHHYDDVLFMQPRTFEGRLTLLERMGATVLTLDDALAQLSAGTLPALPVVLTIDDGWATSAGTMARSLSRRKMPATLYVATAYTPYPRLPVFDVAVGWLLWRLGQTGGPLTVDLSAVEPGVGVLDLSTPIARRAAHQELRLRGESLTVPARHRLVTALAEALGAELDSPALHSASIEALAALAPLGVDVQLHTHNHRMPRDETQLAEELRLNRSHLRSAARSSLRHLCFPSGEYRPEQLRELKNLGVASGTTCLPGLNDVSTPRLELRRFLDRDRLSGVEVEAELSGLSEWLRNLGQRLTPRSAPQPTAQQH